ncbi:MAG: hypothetical protein Q9204_001296 [Flavoplaca sp. TL-2023a]
MSASEHQSENSDDDLGPNTLDDEDEWKDVESEDFGTSFVSFGGKNQCADLKDFLQDAKANHGVDLLGLRNRHGMVRMHRVCIPGKRLETYGMIKLINFIREQVSQGLFRPDVSPETFLEGDRYMKPFLEDDALLYSIDDILDLDPQTIQSSANKSKQKLSDGDIQELLKQNDQLREQVKYYRNAYQEAYLENLDLKERRGSEPREHDCNGQQAKEKDHDTHYFSSYDHSG